MYAAHAVFICTSQTVQQSALTASGFAFFGAEVLCIFLMLQVNEGLLASCVHVMAVHCECDAYIH